MKKEITIATFNVCSGVFVPDDTNSFNQDKSPEIDKSFLDKIISIINEEEIDIIAFQEIITTEHVGYIDAITKQTDLKYSCILELSECHLVENVNCGVATLSRHPITEERSIFFTNPNLSVTSKSGSTYHSFEKGMQKMKITIGDKTINFSNCFFVPYIRFNASPKDHPRAYEELDDVVSRDDSFILAGDFNADNLPDLISATSKKSAKLFDKQIVVDGIDKYDHIFITDDYAVKNTKMIKTISDHHLLIARLETETTPNQ